MNEQSGYENGERVPTVSLDAMREADERDGTTTYEDTTDPHHEQPRVYSSEEEAVIDAMYSALLLVVDAEKPRLAGYQILDLIGKLEAVGGTTGTKIAKEFGISKQNYEQTKNRVAEKLCISFQTRRMKGKKSSASYSLSNHRNTKQKA